MCGTSGSQNRCTKAMTRDFLLGTPCAVHPALPLLLAKAIPLASGKEGATARAHARFRHCPNRESWSPESSADPVLPPGSANGQQRNGAEGAWTVPCPGVHVCRAPRKLPPPLFVLGKQMDSVSRQAQFLSCSVLSPCELSVK